MGVYQRRPEFVQAEQFTLENFQKCLDLTNGTLKNVYIPRCLDGVMTATIGKSEWGIYVTLNDYIVKKDDGTFVVYNQKTFEDTYGLAFEAR
jgi:hypothetical protein